MEDASPFCWGLHALKEDFVRKEPEAMPRPAQMIGRRHTLGGGLAHSPLPYLIPALLVGAALLAATVLVWAGVRWWNSTHAIPPAVTVSATQVPSSPVAALDRVYLTTRVANPGDQRVENLTVELAVVGPDGNVALQSRQKGITLSGHDARTVSWAWRVPGAATSGSYSARATVLGPDGRVLASSSGPAASFEVQAR